MTFHVAERRALLPRPAADPLPLPDQGARRAAAARRRAAHARVHHEGRLHLRPRPRRAWTQRYEKHVGAYDRIFDRVGLEWYRVESDVGMMGGVGAHEYMAPCAAGENDVALGAGYAANVEVARAEPQPVELPGRAAPRRSRCDTPGADHDRRRSRSALGVPAGALLKAFPVIVEDRGLVLVVVRGDHRVNEIKLANALGAPFRAGPRGGVAERIGPAGFIGPVGADVADPARRGRRADGAAT